MSLTRRAFVALVGSLPFAKGLVSVPVQAGASTHAAPPPLKQRYFATASLVRQPDKPAFVAVRLLDLAHRKTWGGTIDVATSNREHIKASFENATQSLLRLAEAQTPDCVLLEARTELMAALLPVFHRDLRPA